jgi:hypothetical protein
MNRGMNKYFKIGIDGYICFNFYRKSPNRMRNIAVVDIFMQDWNESIFNANSLSLYRNFKCSFEFESYLNNLPRKFRTVLCRLRLASHKLHIETGRYTQNITDRFMHVCEVMSRMNSTLSLFVLHTIVRVKYVF